MGFFVTVLKFQLLGMTMEKTDCLVCCDLPMYICKFGHHIHAVCMVAHPFLHGGMGLNLTKFLLLKVIQ